ncbi:MAG: hypothetical protein DRH34_12775 [Deltaproteobacteria bacterium]|nr:MAG: hypothetical protein DRH34_12775 [Deltaproteobacteria bacterium]RLC20146.1 MAG: hypothetical protein DRH93_14225 [Deltaproteobacteria bacterium]
MKNCLGVNGVNDKILKVKQLLVELESDAKQFPALDRNSKRALASIKMLELNISDIVAFDLADS